VTEYFWAEPGKLLAGPYPGAYGDEAAARARVEAILRHGVTLFVDLTEEGELDAYAHRLAERPAAAVSGSVPRHLRRPVVDMAVSTDEELAATLDAIDDELGRGGVVFVHCWGGCGRTGTVISCWWVRHGLEPREALDRFQERCRAYTRLRCPQTPEQVAVVLGWSAGR
jgi:rhodanese/phosphatase family protein